MESNSNQDSSSLNDEISWLSERILDARMTRHFVDEDVRLWSRDRWQMVSDDSVWMFPAELRLSTVEMALVYYISLDQAYNNLEQTFFKHGLNLGLWCGSNDSLYVIIPLNADDKYFNSLREGFTKTLQDFNQRKSRFFSQTP